MIRRSEKLLSRLALVLLCFGLLVPMGCISRDKANKTATRATDRTFEQLLSAADASLTEQGDATLSLGLYTQALDRAHLINDINASATASLGRAASLARLRRYEESLVALKTIGPAPAIKQQLFSNLLESRIQLELSNIEAAVQALSRAESMQTELTPASTRLLVLLTKGHLAAMSDDSKAAAEVLERIDTPLSPQLSMYRFRLQGTLASANKEYAAAAKAHIAESDAARQCANWPAAAEALARAATAYIEFGDHASAAESYFRAGRSAKLQKDANLPAEQWLTRAIASAEMAGDDAIVQSAKQMLSADP